MNFKDQMALDTHRIFFKEFAEEIFVGTQKYLAIIDLISESSYGKAVKTMAKIVCATKFPYGTIIIYNSVEWRVEEISGDENVYVHTCSSKERIGYGI